MISGSKAVSGALDVGKMAVCGASSSESEVEGQEISHLGSVVAGKNPCVAAHPAESLSKASPDRSSSPPSQFTRPSSESAPIFYGDTNYVAIQPQSENDDTSEPLRALIRYIGEWSGWGSAQPPAVAVVVAVNPITAFGTRRSKSLDAVGNDEHKA
ncbi:hypothetical protein B0H10DRAFT_1964109 [Mycena sp. CBHHK59/15]|nr:hypothetical protein B0H10DRAFT_1964109 [Mycena sp. CBHHK59/15]